MELIKSSGVIAKVPMFKGFETEFKGSDIGSTVKRIFKEKPELEARRYGDIKRLPLPDIRKQNAFKKYVLAG